MVRRSSVRIVAVMVAVAVVAAGCSSSKKKKHTPQPLRITTSSLPDATERSAYSLTVQATGGNAANYNWSISGQPSWLSIDTATGKLSGTPPVGSAGTYTFTVEVTDGQQTASRQFDLVVNAPAPLKADFEANPTQGTPPLAVTFTDKSSGNPTSWEWDFDNDGTVDSTQQSPTYTYSNPGWYTVRLTVSHGTDSDTCIKEMYILVANNIWYVNGNGGDDGNGGADWSDAFATIGKALSVADDYDLVLVADATYNETDLRFNGKKIYLKGVDHNTAGAQPVIDCQGNGRAFCFDSGETKDSVVDSFMIQNGDADAGGAIRCKSSSPTLINCTFSGNSASYDGGAIRCAASSSPTITNCAFNGNSATWGGAICCSSSSPTVTNCTFGSNIANEGGAIYCYYSSSPTVTNCTFGVNFATWGGAIYCFFSSSPTLTNCTFSGNSADYGGAIYCRQSSNLTITNCAFNGNTVDNGCGGAIYCNSSSPTITNCTFSGNDAWDYGGAISCDNSGSPTLNNCILWGNTASSSGNEIYIADTGSSCTLNYCCVDNTGYGFASGVPTTTIDDTNNCIFVDPQFVDAANGDYHLQDTSPCIDAGDNNSVPSGVDKDLDGKQRIVDGNNNGTATVDIGAYEYQP